MSGQALGIVDTGGRAAISAARSGEIGYSGSVVVRELDLGAVQRDMSNPGSQNILATNCTKTGSKRVGDEVRCSGVPSWQERLQQLDSKTNQEPDDDGRH